eukprot:s5404_g7.t1
MGHMGSHAKVAPAIQFTTRQGAARPSCHETCVCLLCCLEVVFLDGRLPHCLLDISKQFKMGFLIVARTVQGTPHDTGANDMLKSAGLKLSASASLPALPDGMADKSTLLKVAKKVPQSRAPNKCAESCNLRVVSEAMSRHSKHSNDRMFFTAKERADAGYSKTRKEVMGTDCFLPFGFCGLTLKAPKDPVATPDGHIFDREAILEYLLQQKLDIQAEQKKFEEQERQREQRLLSADKEVQLKELEAFTNAEQGLLSQDHRHKRALEQVDAVREGVPEKKLRRGELLVVDKSQLRAKSFWTKEFTPTAAPTEVKKVDATTRCPMTGKKLKVKDLIPVKMEIADQKLMDQGGGKGVYCCAVSKNAIIHQQALLLKPSGVVILESVWKDIVSKEMKCPVTGKKLRGEEDLLKLERGGSGFSAHNDVEAKSFTMIRSATGDNRTQAGHLPRAGYAGLH